MGRTSLDACFNSQIFHGNSRSFVHGNQLYFNCGGRFTHEVFIHSTFFRGILHRLSTGIRSASSISSLYLCYFFQSFHLMSKLFIYKTYSYLFLCHCGTIWLCQDKNDLFCILGCDTDLSNWRFVIFVFENNFHFHFLTRIPVSRFRCAR